MKLTYVFIAVVLTGGIAAASNFYLANETVEDGENSDGAVRSILPNLFSRLELIHMLTIRGSLK